MRLRWAVLATLTAVALAGGRPGTAGGAVVSGVVLDPSEASVPGAEVALLGPDGAVIQTVSTGSAGGFRFEGVAPGSYRLKVTKEGFRIFTAPVEARREGAEPLRIVLQIAQGREQVTVAGRAERVSTEPSQNVDVVRLDRRMLTSLPILDNDVVGAAAEFVDTGMVGSGGVTLVVDGMETSRVGVTASAIQEIRINKNPYSAEFRRPGRGRIEVITKPAVPQFHGAFNFLFRDGHLDARNAFAAEKPQEQRRIYEGHLTGPVGKSRKTSFLISGERREDNLQSVVYALTPSGEVRENVPAPRRGAEFSGKITRALRGGRTLSFRYEFEDESARSRGAGGFVLPEAAYDWTNRENHIYFNYMTPVGKNAVSQFYFRGGRHDGHTRSRQPGVRKIVVLDAFTGGGAQAEARSTENHFELSEVVFWNRGKHAVKAGLIVDDVSRRGQNDQRNTDGTFYFSSLDDYTAGRPYSFTQQRGEGHLAIWQKELALFFQDDIRLRPGLAVGVGVRWDFENFTPDYDNFSPRLSIAYGLGKQRKTVLRAGAGYFYDRVGWRSAADTVKYDGQRLQQIVITDPGYPDPFAGGGMLTVLPSNVVRFAPDLSSAYILTFSGGVERQLWRSATVSVNYVGSRGVKLFRSRDLNAPLPPSFERPDPSIAILRQIESSGRLKSNFLEIAMRGKLFRWFDGIVRYRTGETWNDTSGVRSLPANSLDLSGEWARADYDERHRFEVAGSFEPAKLFRLGVILRMHTGRPYTLTTGRDDNRDGLAIDRPPGVPRNSLEGPGYARLDLRWAKEFPVGRSDEEHKRVLAVGVDAFNVLNRVNVTRVVGNQSSPFFGQPVRAAAARRLQMFLSFRF